MLRFITLFTLLLTISFNYAQQKKPLTHEDYDLWKRVQSSSVSDNGKTVVSTIVTGTGRGDGYIRIYNTETGEFFNFENGYKSSISDDGRYVFFLRRPAYELTRQEKKKKTKEEKRAKDDFFIFDVNKGKILDSISRVKSYKVPREGSDYVVIEKFKDLRPAADTTAKKPVAQEKPNQKKQINRALFGNYAVVYNLEKNEKDTIFRIKEYVLPEEGSVFAFSTTKEKKKGDIGVYAYNVRQMGRRQLDVGSHSYKGLAVADNGNQIAFLAARDSTKADSLKYELFYTRGQGLIKVTDTLGKNLKKNWKVSPAQRPYFSENGQRLYFFSRAIRKFNTDTTLLQEEIPDVDVWTYRDELIQPEQKARLKELQNKAYQSYFDPATGRVVQLNNETVENLLFDDNREQRYILGYTDSPYRVERSWAYPWLKDFYIIDSHTGKKRKAISGLASTPELSPDGSYAVYFEQETQDWWALDLSSNTKRNLTEGLPVKFYDEENDVPALPWAYGYGGWTADGEVLIYDKYDIWKIPMAPGQKRRKITKGREDEIVYRTLRLDRENPNRASYYNNNLLINAFDEKDKSEALYTLDLTTGRRNIVVPDGDYHLGGFEVAEDSNELLFRKENFYHYPDLYLLEDPGAKPVQITNANPQQREYRWGSVELFTWEAYDGTELEGLLYYPENFDPSKNYPMITYFYEKRSDNLNRYHSPQPSASTVNFSFLTSNGYVVFVPDIIYKEGKPGESAYNAILSGVEAVEDLGFIDSENIGIQGQSWGGYQVAHLITVTNKFDAAMAGAPVANMTSAYGGIRWQSGLSRAFQYEKTQSRIGKNLWEGLDLYIENSPLFGIPNIETPLLIMHNDADGAVPYEQGIEMFMGMRRLNKPVWLLVYNDEAHNLKKMKNRQDLSIRMMQFFDHFLKDAPAPEWMTKGLPAVRKGKDLRYDLEESTRKPEKISSN